MVNMVGGFGEGAKVVTKEELGVLSISIYPNEWEVKMRISRS